ncbi:hypothetical protein LABOLPEG_00015 [Pseudomonas phage phi 21A]|nr:hypothetical protein LABOLPEG_00015 [Pseudomonas phage phi 21A]
MCFKSKMKVPKPQAQQLQAPEPMLLEPPKGVEVGDGADDQTDKPENASKGIGSLTISKPKGDGAQKAVSTDTGASKSPAIKRALKR